MKFIIYLFILFFFKNYQCVLTDFQCDFKFGDPSWNYSKIFYNKTFNIQPYETIHQIVIPKEDGNMINFVCVKLQGYSKQNAEAAFSAMFGRVTVKLLKPVSHPVKYNVVAKAHGY